MKPEENIVDRIPDARHGLECLEDTGVLLTVAKR
jgi:hypothetical protein